MPVNAGHKVFDSAPFGKTTDVGNFDFRANASPLKMLAYFRSRLRRIADVGDLVGNSPAKNPNRLVNFSPPS